MELNSLNIGKPRTKASRPASAPSSPAPKPTVVPAQSTLPVTKIPQLSPIYVDTAVGSNHLVALLEKRGLTSSPANTIRDFNGGGDVVFEGVIGPNNLQGIIGIEIKTFADLCDSIYSRRLDSQLSRMLETYNVNYLLTEGLVDIHGYGTTSPSVVHLANVPTTKEPDRRLWYKVKGGKASIDYWFIQGCVNEWQTAGIIHLNVPAHRDKAFVVDQIVHLYKFYQRRWESHKLYNGTLGSLAHSSGARGNILRAEITPIKMLLMGAKLGIGEYSAGVLVEKFGTVDKLVQVSLNDLKRAIGPERGTKVYEYLRK